MPCEDYPCCGHGPPPMGDGGGCPVVDEDGNERFACCECGELMKPRAPSAICSGCRNRWAAMDPDEREYEDQLREQRDRDSY